MVVALAGRRIDAPDAQRPRFPLANVDAVGKRLRTLLARLMPSAIVCSAACGADLLALDAARKLGIRRRIVLPFDAPGFRATSVVDRPGDWGALFDSLYEEARSRNDLVILSHEEGGDQDAYAATTDRIVAEAFALLKGQGGRRGAESSNDGPTAVVVWEGGSRGEGDLTAEFAELARKRGMRVVEVETVAKPEVRKV
jgi:hypothetical protein